MKQSHRTGLVALLLSALATVAMGATFPYFTPATGILKGNANSPTTTAATGSDVLPLITPTSPTWTGNHTFDPTTGVALTLAGNDLANVLVLQGGLSTGQSFGAALSAGTSSADYNLYLANASGTELARLYGNGALTLGSPTGGQKGAGTINATAFYANGTLLSGVTPAALTKTDDTNVTLALGGTPATSLLQATSLTLGWTGTLAASRGGTGLATVTDDTVLVANGSAWQSKALTDCDAATSAVTYDTTANAWGCNTISGATGANPSASIGTTATNGVATTFMRSDAAPALNLAITPTWTGAHTWSGTSGQILTQTASSTTAFIAHYLQNDASAYFRMALAGSANGTAFTTNGPTGQAGYLYTTSTSQPISIGTNGIERVRVADGGTTVGIPTGGAQGNGTINATGLFINGVPVTGGATTTGSFTATMTGLTAGVTCTMRYRITGSTVFLYANTSCTGTSNSNNATFTGLPAAIQPARGVACLTTGNQDNGTVVLGGADIGGGITAGTVQLNKMFVSGANLQMGASLWTSSGTKGPTSTWSCIYDIDS